MALELFDNIVAKSESNGMRDGEVSDRADRITTAATPPTRSFWALLRNLEKLALLIFHAKGDPPLRHNISNWPRHFKTPLSLIVYMFSNRTSRRLADFSNGVNAPGGTFRWLL
jgi:hypothetical protein